MHCTLLLGVYLVITFQQHYTLILNVGDLRFFLCACNAVKGWRRAGKSLMGHQKKKGNMRNKLPLLTSVKVKLKTNG